MWYKCHHEVGKLEFHDLCYSVHCNDHCPEKLNLMIETVTSYPDWAKIVVIVIVVSITAFSLIMKVKQFT